MRPQPALRTAALTLLIVLVCLMIAALGLRRIWTVDYWWQWKTGEYVTQHGAPRTAIYSATNPDHERIELRWGYCLALYETTRRLGHGSAVVFKTLAVVLTFVVVGLIAARPPNVVGSAAVVAIAALAASQRFYVRPEIVSYLMLALFLLVVEQARRRSTRWVLLLPVLQVVWVNCHGLFVLGPAVVGAWLAAELIEAARGRWRNGEIDPERPRRIRTSLLLLAGLAAASLINPYGYRAALLPILQFSALHGTAMKEFYSELTSPFEFTTHYVALDYYKLLIGIVALSAVANFRRLRAYWVILVVAMLYLSVSAIRNLPLFSLVAIPFTVRNFDESELWNRSWAKRLLPAGRLALGVLVAGFCLYQIQQLYTDRFHIRQLDTNQFGIGVARHRFPEGGTDFLLWTGVDGPLFNGSDAGAYLMARGFDVFIDPRGEIYMARQIDEYKQVVEVGPAMREIVDRYGFRVMFLESTMTSLIQYLQDREPERWRPVYADPVSVIFYRSDVAPEIPRLDLRSRGREWLDAMRVSLPRPVPAGEQGWLDRLVSPTPYERLARVTFALGAPDLTRELLEDARSAAPEQFRNQQLLAHVMRATGDRTAATALQQEAVQRDPRNAALRLGLAELHIAANELAAAAEQLDVYLELQPDDAATLALRGRIAMRLNRPDEGVRRLRQALEVDPANPDFRFQLGQALMLAGRLDEAARAFELAFEAGASKVRAALNLAQISLRRGDLATARAWVGRARELAPDDPEVVEAWNAIGQP